MAVVLILAFLGVVFAVLRSTANQQPRSSRWIQRQHGLFFPLTNSYGLHTHLVFLSSAGLHAIVTDAEQVDIRAEVAKHDPMWRLHVEQHRPAVVRYLGDLAVRDRSAFISRYVYRDAYDDDARRLFPAMVVGYEIVTGHARYQNFGQTPTFDRQRTYTIHLCGKGPRQGTQLTVGAIVFSIESLQRVQGTIDDFVITTDTMSIRFAGGGVFLVTSGVAHSDNAIAAVALLPVAVPS